jgi:uncharacterized membrane protein YsdA (DUF1294 family)
VARSPSTARGASSREATVQHPRSKLLAFAGLCALPVGGAVQMALGGRSWVPLLAYVLLSVVCLLLYWKDKRQARQQGQRTPEKVLHGVELLGGWPGALLAQQLFRHKTRKVSYQITFWAIVVVHQVVWVDYLLMGGRWASRVLAPLFG